MLANMSSVAFSKPRLIGKAERIQEISKTKIPIKHRILGSTEQDQHHLRLVELPVYRERWLLSKSLPNYLIKIVLNATVEEGDVAEPVSKGEVAPKGSERMTEACKIMRRCP